MFGISDPAIWLVYLLSILCVIGSVVFGVLTWNKKDKEENTSENKKTNINSKQ
ncbi:MAG: hypothetical protein IKS00_05330 [Bacteroidales bacterium]|nr:hypothetical protein [Bacteroidales bacterium]